MNAKANDWHPFQGLTQGVAVTTRQQTRRKLMKQFGVVEGKREWRRQRGLWLCDICGEFRVHVHETDGAYRVVGLFQDARLSHKATA